jgi:MYXO-CTERM domain-containing protein
VLQASSIQGNGVISANMLRCSGTLDPGIGSGATEVEEFSQKQAQSTSRVLEIEGALELDGGVIDATVGGTNVGELDQVNVIGDATLMGTTIKLRFENGFAATEGDDFPVLTANGALTTEDLLVETEGLDESLDVMLTNEGGVLTLTTTNAADQPRGDVEQSGGSGGGCVAAPSTRVGGASNPENVIGFAALTAAALLIARRRRKVGGARG